MKLTIVLLTTAFLNVQAATGLSQSITLSGKDVPLKQIFAAIKKQTGYVVFYNFDAFKNTTPVSIIARDMPLSEFLSIAFKSQPINYRIEDKTIVLSRKVAVTTPEQQLVLPPLINIRSRVTTLSGGALLPISGATIMVKETNKSTITNDDGYFILRNVDVNSLLVISSVSYITQEIKVNALSDVIILQVNNSKLDEVQVIGYGTTTRRLTTSNITTVQADDIEKQPVTNPLYALQGRVPGLIITPTSGLPNAPVKLQIHGQNSLSGTFTQPLVIIDGIPIENNIPGPKYGTAGDVNDPNLGVSSLSFVNPSDIESISVLKDGDATSIYGSRGANGVILITSKRGKIGRTNVTINANTGFSYKSTNLKLMNTQQYLALRREAFENDGIDFTTPPYDDPNVQAAVAPDLFVYDQNRNTDWQKVMTGNAARYYDADVSISGGNSQVQYRLSGTYHKDGFVFPQSDAKNRSESGMGSFTLTGTSPNQKLKMSLTSSYTANKYVAPGDFTAASLDLLPNAPALYLPDGSLNWEPDAITGFATWENPLASLLRVITSNTTAIRNSLVLSYKIIPTLSIQTRFGFTKTLSNSFIPDPIASHDPAKIAQIRGSSIFSNGSSRTWLFEPQATYSRYVAKGRLEVLFGASLQGASTETQLTTATGFPSDVMLHNLASAISTNTVNSGSQYKAAGLFGRINYNLFDKYILNLGGRRDGSARFGPGKRFGNFGSVGAAWVFTNENFLKKALHFMDFGKLRLNYGNSGNDQIGSTEYVETYKSLQYTFFDPTQFKFVNIPLLYQGATTIKSNGVNNSDYHWENVRKLGAGIDLSFFNERIIASADYFRTRCDDQLVKYNLPATGGNSYVIINQPAEIQNEGFEFTLNTTNILTKNFKWGSIATLTLQRNKLLSVSDEAGFGYNSPLAYHYILTGGSPIGQPFSGIIQGYEFRGVDPATGVYQFADEEGNTVVGTNDPVTGHYANFAAKIIDITPKYFGSFSNTFSYKNFSLGISLQFIKQLGRNYLFDFSGGLPGVGGRNVSTAFLDRWRKPGDITNVQRVTSQGYFIDQNSNLINLGEAALAAMNSDAGWVDASFIRVKNAYLSYGLPNKWIKRLHLQNVGLSVNMQNIWTFTKYKGADPETQNVSGFAPARTITAGLQIGL